MGAESARRHSGEGCCAHAELRRCRHLDETGRPWRPWNTETRRKVRRTAATQGGGQVGFDRDSLQVGERLGRTGHGPPMCYRQGFRHVRLARIWRAGRPVGVGAGGASGIGVPGTIAGHRFAGRAARAAGLAGFCVRVLVPAGLAVFLRSPWRPLEDRLPRREDQGAGRRAPEHKLRPQARGCRGALQRRIRNRL